MTEPEQLEFDFSYDHAHEYSNGHLTTTADFKYARVMEIAKDMGYQPSRPLWKKLLLTPFTTVYHTILFIMCVSAVLILMLMCLKPVVILLLRILCMPFILISWLCCALCWLMIEAVQDLWKCSKHII